MAADPDLRKKLLAIISQITTHKQNWRISSVVFQKQRRDEKKEGKSDTLVTPQQSPQVKQSRKQNRVQGAQKARSASPTQTAKLALTATGRPFSSPVMMYSACMACCEATRVPLYHWPFLFLLFFFLLFLSSFPTFNQPCLHLAVSNL